MAPANGLDVQAGNEALELPLRATVVVPIFNSRRFLVELVEALERQTVPREEFEVILVDDGSTDGGPAGIAEESDWLRVLGPAEPRNQYEARNRGARIARGRTLVFLDHDCVPVPGWLEAGLEALRRTEIVAGAIRFRVPADRTVWTLMDMENTKDQERLVQMGYAETANLFVDRELFEHIGGFDPRFPSYGDFDLVRRGLEAGGRLSFAADATCLHPTRDTPLPFLRMVWSAHRAYAAREVAAGGVPEAAKLRSWVPVVQPYRSRRRIGRPVTVGGAWLEENGVSPTGSERVLTLPLMYLLLPYAGLVAQLLGWRDGAKLRRGATG